MPKNAYSNWNTIFASCSYTNKKELQSRIESTKFNGGSTKTGEAMNLALEHYKQKQRNAKTTARVRNLHSFVVVLYTIKNW